MFIFLCLRCSLCLQLFQLVDCLNWRIQNEIDDILAVSRIFFKPSSILFDNCTKPCIWHTRTWTTTCSNQLLLLGYLLTMGWFLFPLQVCIVSKSFIYFMIVMWGYGLSFSGLTLVSMGSGSWIHCGSAMP